VNSSRPLLSPKRRPHFETRKSLGKDTPKPRLALLARASSNFLDCPPLCLFAPLFHPISSEMYVVEKMAIKKILLERRCRENS
jgi:hypothetical protein